MTNIIPNLLTINMIISLIAIIITSAYIANIIAFIDKRFTGSYRR